MPNAIQQEIDEIKAKKKLSGGDRARIKVLERELKQQQKNESSESKPKGNVFATQPTTKINPLPVRFSNGERIHITEIGNDIKTQNQELVINELGSLNDINDTKLIRAAVYLLGERSHEEIVDAIKQVKLNMIR